MVKFADLSTVSYYFHFSPLAKLLPIFSRAWVILLFVIVMIDLLNFDIILYVQSVDRGDHDEHEHPERRPVDEYEEY